MSTATAIIFAALILAAAIAVTQRYKLVPSDTAAGMWRLDMITGETHFCAGASVCTKLEYRDPRP